MAAAQKDITVLGAGIFGLSCAYACAKRGASVRVIDPAGPGGGASGGIVGALAPHTPENWNPKKQFQFDSLIQSRSFWPDIAERSRCETGYRRTGRLQPIADDHALDLAEARAEQARELWQGQADWRVTRDQDGPWVPPSPTGAWIYDTLSAHIHPRLAIFALAQALKGMGVEITEDGSKQGRTIDATGAAGLGALTERRGRLVGAGIKGQAILLAHDAGPDAPQIFADTLHIMPHVNGTVAVGSTTEREFTSPTATDAQLDTVLTRAEAVLPALKGAKVLDRWAGLRPRARSRAPMLGPDPDIPNRYIANGGFKIGFGMAPKVGEVIADLVLDDRDTIPKGFHVTDNW
ncbi:NAD(P)/FAD-dependent oxidoreductase [Shimia ponticola]|uniref:NAD(P)/FAD-dependent oxidoreductase n=1 Tax=Shimia ponticola TaxID=2582893 RepID=UPI0011BFDEF6|nr:FAD-dependent oxidoreductase [Shimia ponticola]